MKTSKLRVMKIFLSIQVLFASLCIGAKVTSGASSEPDLPAAPAFQQFGNYTRDITFREMGFTQPNPLPSPWSSFSLALSIPDGWQISSDSYLELNMTFTANMVAKDQQTVWHPTLEILLDGRMLAQHLITESSDQTFQIRTALPLDPLNDINTRDHTLTIRLDSTYICINAYRSTLTVLPESLVHLAYQQLPAYPDLSMYPRPIYGGNLQTNSVLFILPQRPSQDELSGAAAIAAKLGQALGSQIVISVTTDVALTPRLAETSHLFVIGTPENNAIISKLNADKLLPIPIKLSRAQLQVQGPAQFPSDGMLGYKAVVTNNTKVPLNDSIVEITLPPEAPPIACSPFCMLGEDGRPRRSLPALSAGQTAEITFTLTLSRPVLLSSVNTSFSLVDAQHEPLSVVTWSTAVTGSTGVANRTSPSQLFVYADRGVDQAVPEVDGVVQEIVSPWNPTKLAVVVSAATTEGLVKASQALGTKTYFPGMSGQVALVRAVQKVSLQKPRLTTDFTLADQEYKDQDVYGFGALDTGFTFDVPFGWTLTDDANAVIRFRHSQVSEGIRDASLTVMINDHPVRSIKLDDSNESQGVLSVPLSKYVYPGRNRVTITSTFDPAFCAVLNSNNYWFSLLSSSEIHLNHLITTSDLDLASYPAPYSLTSDLSDLIFALPNPPSAVEREALLHLASTLGSAANGDSFVPKVIFDVLPEEALRGKHIIAIGRPSVSPMIQQLNGVLPQPFIRNTDQILQTVNSVIFSSLPAAELGVIEQIPSIWDPTKSVLVVTGTSDTGVDWAGTALAHLDTVKGTLQGNLAAVHGLNVNSFDTRGSRSSVAPTLVLPSGTTIASPVAKAVTPPPEVNPTSIPLPAPTAAPTVPASPTPSGLEWRFQLGLAISALLLLTGLIAGIIWWRRQRNRNW